MNKKNSVIIATLLSMSFAAVVFATVDDTPIVIAGPNAATSAIGIKKAKAAENPAKKAAKARTKADTKYLRDKVKTDAKEADSKAAKEQKEADIKAAKDLDTNLK